MADNLFVIKRNGKRQRFVYEKIFVSIFTVINIRKNRDNGDDAKLAKRITQTVMKKLFVASSGKNITTNAIIEFVYEELRKEHSSYADRYIAYSDYRLSVAASNQVFQKRPLT